MITVPPDPKGALLVWLKASPDITAICPAANIRGNLADLPPNGYAIAVVKAGGPLADPYAPLIVPRFDLHVYGPTAYEAMRLWRVVYGLLEPADRRTFGWTAANCRVLDSRFETGPVEITEDGGWNKVWCAVSLRCSAVPV